MDYSVICLSINRKVSAPSAYVCEWVSEYIHLWRCCCCCICNPNSLNILRHMNCISIFFFAFTSSKLSRPSYHFSHLIHAVWLWYYPDAVFPHSNSISYSSSSSLRTFFLLVLSFFRRFRFVSILFTRHSTFLLFPLFSCLLAGLLDFLYLVWFGLVWLETLFAHTVFFSSVCEIISDTEWMWVFMYIYIKRVQEIRVLFYLSPRYTMYIFVGAVGSFFLFLSLAHSQSVYLIRPKNTREWMS